MCIKIVRLKQEVSYDQNMPLEEQIRGSKQIVVNYEPKDPSIDKFLGEVERLCKNGISASMNITFNHNNYLNGARMKKEAIKLSKDLEINELVKMMVMVHAETDKKLEELASHCLDGGNSVK